MAVSEDVAAPPHRLTEHLPPGPHLTHHGPAPMSCLGRLSCTLCAPNRAIQASATHSSPNSRKIRAGAVMWVASRFSPRAFNCENADSIPTADGRSSIRPRRENRIPRSPCPQRGQGDDHLHTSAVHPGPLEQPADFARLQRHEQVPGQVILDAGILPNVQALPDPFPAQIRTPFLPDELPSSDRRP